MAFSPSICLVEVARWLARCQFYSSFYWSWRQPLLLACHAQQHVAILVCRDSTIQHSIFAFVMGSSFYSFQAIPMMWPNKSPEPTAVGAVRSAVAVHIASRRRLSFFR